MKSWDVIIVGGGIIGLSLAISLRKQSLRVLVVERGEPGREASWAAAGMLAGSSPEIPSALKNLAEESARLYPAFTHELEDESGIKIDLRDQGTVLFSGEGEFPANAEPLSPQRLRSLEPALSPRQNESEICAAYLSERSVDPRALMTAATKAARHREVDVASGSEVKAVVTSRDRVTGVETKKTSYSAPVVINCAGAWAGYIAPHLVQTWPVKGQMLSVLGGPPLRHVVRSAHVYLVPRSDGRIVIGSTLEDAGFNKQTEVGTIQQLLHKAIELVPGLHAAKVHQDWAGLRPGTADGLPILGETSIRGYFAATGHYRDGILLAPVTAQLMTEVLSGKPCSFDLSAFNPNRFAIKQSG